MESVKQPLSPRLQIYKPRISPVFSITRRAMGLFPGLGLTIPAACKSAFATLIAASALTPLSLGKRPALMGLKTAAAN